MDVNESEPEAHEASAGVPTAPSGGGLSRRGLLGLAVGGGVAGLAVGLGAGTAGGVALGRARAAEDAESRYEFFGAHQAGITTPVQDHLHFASFDMMPRTDRDDLISLLQDWSYAAARMTQGLEVSASGAVNGPAEAPRMTRGGAGAPRRGSDPHLRVRSWTVRERGRRSLRSRRPAATRSRAASGLPRGRPRSRGVARRPVHPGLCRRPQVAVHAIRNLSRIAFGRARLRWSQLGFGKTSRTTAGQATPRNLFGFKDGTANILADDATALADHVWVSTDDEPSWMAGGSYLVARKIAMLIETWDRVRLAEQDTIIGRDKGVGRRSPAVTSSRPRTSAARRSMRTVTSGSRIPSRTTASASCAAGTTTSTATTPSGDSTPGCSSCPTSVIPPSSSACSADCRPTVSTSTSVTWAQASGRSAGRATGFVRGGGAVRLSRTQPAATSSRAATASAANASAPA